MPIKKKVPAKKADISKNEKLSAEKIKSLQEMIASAEQTIVGAKQMLAQMKGKEIKEKKMPTSPDNIGEEKIIYGNFDGQIMIGQDNKQYPVPANYASKSKLVEGDMLKLTITGEGNFVYKQVGPVERKYLIGIAQLDERGNHTVSTNGKKYKVLLAAATYFKIEPGDEVTLVVPRENESVWGAIENVLRKADDVEKEGFIEKNYNRNFDEIIEKEKTTKDELNFENETEEEDLSEKENLIEEEDVMADKAPRNQSTNADILDEWTPDLEAIKKEASFPARNYSE